MSLWYNLSVMTDKLKGREVIIEYHPVGTAVKVSAMDTITMTEVTIQGPASAGEHTLKQNVLKKLAYVLEKEGVI